VQNPDALARLASDPLLTAYQEPQEMHTPKLAPVPPPPFHPARTTRAPDQATVLPLAQQAFGFSAGTQLHLLRQAGQAFTLATSEREIWQALITILKETCQFAACSLLQGDAADTYQLVVVIRRPLSQHFLQQNIERLGFAVLRSGMPPVKLPQLAGRQVLEASHESSSDSASAQPPAEHVESFIAHPLVSRGRNIGMIGLADERWDTFDSEHEEFLASLADYAAIALENLRLRQAEQALCDQVHLAALNDITDRKHIEKWKDDFLSSVSHELRTPLTPIKGYTQHLLRRAERRLKETANAADDETRPTAAERYEHRCLGIIQSEAEHLERLVNNLLDFSLLQRGNIQLHQIPFDLAELVKQTVQSIQVSSEQHRITVNVLALETVVRADRERVRVIIGNLIDNAIKYSPNGGPVSISMIEDEHELVVAVSDKGIGIAPEQFEHLFDRFYRPSALGSQQYGGIGVSLYLAQAILKLHNGRIWAKNSHNQDETGALVAFALPKERAPRQLEPVNTP
jgi:signal transduction histidine kinase